MTIPSIDEIHKPLLRRAAKGKQLSLSEIIDELADQFKLTKAERKEEVSSGNVTVFSKRCAWALHDLVKAGLVDRPSRGVFQITKKGLEVIKENPKEINRKYLEEHFQGFSKYMDISRGTSERAKPERRTRKHQNQSPEELIGDGFMELRGLLISDLIEQIKLCSPSFFEKLILDLMLKMGYGGSRVDAGQVVGKIGDGGIDGLIKEDKLGLDVVYLQAKRWEAQVGRPVVQAFAGSLEGVRANKGVIITTSTFSKDAYEYVKTIGKKIVLIDGEKLAELMIDHNVGVTKVMAYEIKRVDTDYFSEE